MPIPQPDLAKSELARRKPFHEIVIDQLASLIINLSMVGARVDAQKARIVAMYQNKVAAVCDLLDTATIPHDHTNTLVQQLVILWEVHHGGLPTTCGRLSETIVRLIALMAEQSVEHHELLEQMAELRRKHPAYPGLQ